MDHARAFLVGKDRRSEDKLLVIGMLRSEKGWSVFSLGQEVVIMSCHVLKDVPKRLHQSMSSQILYELMQPFLEQVLSSFILL